ncbi:hypothetical protein ANCCAN_07731 [Ancylostoma caninum]|uniref:Uncharacterized protein n=1 Tax=Ancylostoma caninum TaxID=29170 RepID=A0A368GT96_ANCCA|nr:hypothetical protein ANCCAN_07731 [Ancylostoma caninum]
MGAKMFYPLAARMVENHVTKYGYKAGAEIELHAMVLEGMNKFAEAEELLGTEESRSLLSTPPSFLMARRIALLLSAGRHQTVIDRTVEGLKIDPDDWTLWKLLFDSSFELLRKAEDAGEQDKILNVLMEAVNADGLSTSRLRGPHLARLELIGRFTKEDEPIRSLLGKMNLGTAIDSMINYVLRFYAKPCCYNDIVQYLWLLNDANKEELIDGLKEFIDSVIHQREQAGEDSDANCWAVIMNERLRRTIGNIDRMPREDRRRHVQLIIRGILQPNREQLAGTALAQLAAAILWNEWRVHDDWQSFYEMILLLEWTSNEYPTDPFCKLVLCRGYAHIGCMYRMVALTRALDIKSVQRDTLGYIMFPMPELCGRFNVGIVHYTEMVEVYEQAEKEISEALIGAYRNGAFMQVPNLVELADKMRRSAMSVGANELHRYLSALFAIDNIDEAVNTLHGNDDTIEWDLLTDNRDLSVIPSFERNIKEELEDIRRDTQQEFVDMTRLRHYLSQAIGSAGGAKGAGPEELGADIVSAKNANGLAAMLPAVEQLEKDWIAMVPPLERKMYPFFIQEEIILSSRALQSLAACQLLIKVLERLGGCRHNTTENAPRKSKSTNTSKNEFTMHCEALQATLRNGAARLSSRLNEIEEVLKENAFSLVPKIGTDWNEELSELFASQNMVVSDRVYKSYFNSCADIRYFLEHSIV